LKCEQAQEGFRVYTYVNERKRGSASEKLMGCCKMAIKVINKADKNPLTMIVY
jgi:hypothetical protein